MFMGTFELKLDTKGRLILPAKYRDQLRNGLVMTRGQEHCLYIFTREEFERMYEEVRQAPLTLRDARAYQRVFLSGAVDDIPDKQGRVLIPPILRRFAGLEREISIIGVGPRLEIWDTEAWNSFLGEEEENFAAQNREVFPGHTD